MVIKITINIAHRGGAGLAPENTLKCFEIGCQYGDENTIILYTALMRL